MVSKLRVEQLETLDGLHTKNVSSLIDDINTAQVTTSTGTQTLVDALEDRITEVDPDTLGVTTGTVPRSLQEHLSQSVTPFDFGAVADDVTDDASAFNASMASGESVYVPKGEYFIGSALTASGPLNMTLHPEAVLRFDSSLDVGLTVEGSVGSNVSLVSNSMFGDSTIALSDASSFSAGDFVLIASEASRTDNQPRKGEVKEIVSISSNTLTVKDIMYDDYRTSDNAFVQKINFIEGVKIEGGRFVGAGDLNNLAVAIDISYARGVDISGAYVDGFNNRGISLKTCINFTVKNNQITGMLNATTGYAILCACACQFGTVSGNYAWNAGKLWDQGGLSSEYGFSRFITVSENSAYHCKRGGISTHETCDFIKIINNIIVGSESHGIFTRNGNVEIVGNTIKNSALMGIMASNRGNRGNISIKNNFIDSFGDYGIFAASQLSTNELLDAHYDSVVITNNTVFGSSEASIYLSSRSPSSLRNTNVSGNTIKNVAGKGVFLETRAAANLLGTVVSGNDMWVGAQAIHFLANGGAINEVVITGNQCVGASHAILAEGSGSGTSRCVVTGNVFRSANGISGIDSSQQFGNIIQN